MSVSLFSRPNAAGIKVDRRRETETSSAMLHYCTTSASPVTLAVVLALTFKVNRLHIGWNRARLRRGEEGEVEVEEVRGFSFISTYMLSHLP